MAGAVRHWLINSELVIAILGAALIGRAVPWVRLREPNLV